MNVQIAFTLAGGVALFLLAMHMMTEGLKTFGGGRLKQIIGSWTSSTTRGVLAGFLISGLVQSSSAVTVAAIGFVNVAMLSLRQGIGVIFGSKLGTTTTAWLVTLVGFGFKIELFALPILTVGVMLRLLVSGKRLQGLGDALAGFGLFFLGLAILKDAFGGLAATYTATVAGNGGGWTPFFLLGIVATTLTQSSSAAIALVLTAAMGGLVGVEAAAVAVVGANVGSMSTAVIAAINATPAAKRLALGNVAYNVFAGVLGLVLVTPLLWSIDQVEYSWQLGHSPGVALAVFQTLLKVSAVCLMLPLVPAMATMLEKMFRSSHEDLGRPRYLDPALSSVPEMAISAVREELLRLRALVVGMLQAAMSGLAGNESSDSQRQASAVRQLGEGIAGFVGTLRMEGMPKDVEADLTRSLRAGRYLGEAARLTHYVQSLHRDGEELDDLPTGAAIKRVLARANDCVALAALSSSPPGAETNDDAQRADAFLLFGESYEQTKVALLAAAVAHRISVETTDALLAELSAMRRAIEQLVKGDRLLRSPSREATIEAEDDMAEVQHARAIRGDDPHVAPEEVTGGPLETHSAR